MGAFNGRGMNPPPKPKKRKEPEHVIIHDRNRSWGLQNMYAPPPPKTRKR